MKRFAGLSVTLLVIALSMLGTGCSQEQAPRKQAAKEQPKLTPEQAQQHVEQVRKSVEQSKKVVVARVNGYDITMHALLREMNIVGPKYVKAGEQTTPEITEKVRKEALDRLILQELAIEKAGKLRLSVKPETLDEMIRKVKEKVGGEEQYREYLKDQAVSEEEFRKMAERHQLSQMVVQKEVFDKISIDEKAMKDDYGKHKNLYMKEGTPPVQMTYEEAKPIIEHKLKAEIGQKKIKEWGQELRKTAKVEVFLDQMEKDAKAREEKSGGTAAK